MRKMTIDLQELYLAILDRKCDILQCGPIWIGDELIYQFEITEDNGISYIVILSSEYHRMKDG